MINKRTAMMGAATLCSALAIGLFMQKTAEHPQRGASASAAVSVAADEAPLEIEAISLTAATPDTTVPEPARQDPAAPCDMSVEAIATPMAEVRLTVLSLCRPEERLTIHHNGMMFSTRLDATGALTVQVPALSETAVFIVEPQNGRGAVATASVPDLDLVNRVVLQWGGNSGFELHAREFGAAYGSAGHVWRGSDLTSGRGSVVQLGDENQLAPRLAEVYSVPRVGGSKTGAIDLTVETEVTAINCGRDISAQTLELRDGTLRTRDLTLAMPDCAATGDFLVLNNLLETLKIAGN
jgi:hemin uptake protein HemP